MRVQAPRGHTAAPIARTPLDRRFAHRVPASCRPRVVRTSASAGSPAPPRIPLPRYFRCCSSPHPTEAPLQQALLLLATLRCHHCDAATAPRNRPLASPHPRNLPLSPALKTASPSTHVPRGLPPGPASPSQTPHRG